MVPPNSSNNGDPNMSIYDSTAFAQGVTAPLAVPPLAEAVTALMADMLRWRTEIELALAHAEFSHTYDDITAMVLRGDLQMHAFDDCFCLTQRNVFPQFTVYHFMIAGGNLNSIVNKKLEFEKAAKALGCKYLSFSGRKGWERALKDAGWAHKFTTMWSEVSA